MDLDIVIANPAGNLTAFVLTPVPREAYIPIAQKIMDRQDFSIEQVGYVKPPLMGGAARLEMMGGEFCGNATRSLGMLSAKQRGMHGRCTIPVECSGAKKPLSVSADLDAGEAETAMPLPVSIQEFGTRESGRLARIAFEGILHVIAPDLACSKENFELVRSLLPRGCLYEALGVMFYDLEESFMLPVVHVENTDTLIFESSCGSGTVAAAVWSSLSCPDGVTSYEIRQPGGTLKAAVLKSGGLVTEVRMGGPVTLYPQQVIRI